jgi:hypothetical protein
VAGFGKPIVKLVGQKALQRKLGTHSDGRTHQSEQNDLGGKQSCSQRPCAR